MYAEVMEHVNSKRYQYLSSRLTKGQRHLHSSMKFLRLLRYSGVKVISLCIIFFTAPDYKPPPNNSASMNAIRF